MSNGEVTRKSHIKRIYKDDDPKTNPDMWVDIERLDELRFVAKTKYPWREKRWKFDWDNFDPDGENVTKKKIKQHPDDSDDDAIEVPVRDMVVVTEGREQQYQGHKHFFINDDSCVTRETHSRRVYKHDILDDFLDDDKNPPRDPVDYVNALEKRDESVYVDVEILDKYWTNERETRDAHGNLRAGNSGIWQEKKWLLDSNVDPLLRDPLTQSDEDAGPVQDDFFQIFNPDAGPQVDPPWRLDPLQNIVNVSWAAHGVFAATRDGVGRQNPCAVVYGKDGTEKINWKPLGGLGIDEGGALFGCSVGGKKKNDDGTTTGKTVFVAVGRPDEGHSVTFGPYGSVIFTSTDGQDWKVTYKKINVASTDVVSAEQAQGIVWDEDDGAFYVSMFAQEQLGHNEAIFSERIYKSTDGMSWELAEEAIINRESIEPKDVDSILLKHCNKPENTGGKHPTGIAKMPDGYQAYNKAADVFMKPKDLKRFSAQGMIYNLAEGQDQLSSTLTIRRPGKEAGQYDEEDKSIGAPCFAVANYGTAWVAGGGESKMDMSFDNGKTWKTSYAHSGDAITHYNICAVVGGKPDKS